MTKPNQWWLPRQALSRRPPPRAAPRPLPDKGRAMRRRPTSRRPTAWAAPLSGVVGPQRMTQATEGTAAMATVALQAPRVLPIPILM